MSQVGIPMPEVHASLAGSPGAASPADPASVHLMRRVLRQPTALVAAAWLGLMLLCAVFADLIMPFDPRKSDIHNILLSPGRAHWLGTDSAGRDVLSRLIMGARISLLAVVLCVVVAASLGVVGGLLAGYFGGWFDTVSSWLVSMLMAMPGLVVLIAVRAVLGRSPFGRSIWMAMTVFGVLITPAFFRLVHVTVRGVRNELYVDAARVAGLSDRRIIGRHILRVVRAPIIIQTAIVCSIAIAVQAGLAVLGLGDTDTPTWGAVLSDGFAKLFRQPWLLLWPSLALASMTLSLAILANALRDELEGGTTRAARRPPAVPDALAGLEALPSAVEHASTAVGASLLNVRDLVVGYADANEAIGWKRVVRGVSFTIAKGEVVGVVGESGSGKTQTAFAVMGLLPAGGRVLGGSIVFDGTELVGASASTLEAVRGRRIAYVPQEPMSNLDPSFTIGAQLVEPLRAVLGLGKAEARARALALLAKVGIPDPPRTFASYPHELSGGMAQRVLIAGAVSCEPDLLIADEPTTALDVTVQAEILDLLRDLQRETHMALMLVTHNFGIVADLCDRVAVMQEGRIVETGPVRAIFSAPEHPYTRSLLDAILEDAPPRAAYTAPAGAR